MIAPLPPPPSRSDPADFDARFDRPQHPEARFLNRLAWGATALAVVVAAVWFTVFTPRIWAECRADGHSRLYCSRLVVR